MSEAKWTMEAAKEEGVPIENIEQSLEFRERSQTAQKVQNHFTAQIVYEVRDESLAEHAVKEK